MNRKRGCPTGGYGIILSPGFVGRTLIAAFFLIYNPISGVASIPLVNVTGVVAGGDRSWAFTTNATLKAWGQNGGGRLGDGTTTDKTTAVSVQGLNHVVCAKGGNHSLALKSDGTVWVWGNNYYGQIGDGTTSDIFGNPPHPIPQKVAGLSGVIAIAAGGSHCLALKSDGSLWAWGGNYSGQLGMGSNSTILFPTQVPGMSGVVKIASGVNHSFAVKAEGAVWAWGDNGYGQLGDGTTTQRWTPVQVASMTNPVAIDGGYYHTLFLQTDGTVWACGWNRNGRLGLGIMDDTTRTTPARVLNVSDVRAIAAGSSHSIALKNDGSVLAWGMNWYGQLGDGNSSTSTGNAVTAQIANVVGIAAANHTLAVKSDGRVWAWGLNGYGQLGDGTTANRSLPVQVLEGPVGPLVIGVSNLRAAQRGGNKMVDMWFDLASPQSGPMTVVVLVSTNNGTSYDFPVSSLSGAVGSSVTPGNNRQVIWNAGTDWNNKLSSQVKFRVIAGGSVSNDSPAITVDTRDGNRPVVQDVSSAYCSWNQHAYFLNVVSLNQTFIVSPEWNGKTPASIKFIGPWGTHTQSGTQTTRTYNVGTDFGVGGTLTVVLVATDGTESLPYRVNFDVVNPPPLIAAANLLFLQGTYGIQVSSPWPMLNEGTSSVPNDDSGNEMPGCTGKPLLFSAKLSYGGEISLDGSWNASLSLSGNSPNWNMLGVGVEPRVYGGVEGQFRNDGWAVGGFGGIGVELSYESPPFYFWYIPPVYGKWAISLDQAVEGHLTYDSIKGLSLNGEFPGELGLEGTVGAGIDRITDIEVFVGGGPYWVFQWPAEPRLKDWGIKLHGGIRWLVFLYKDEVSLERSWSGTSSGLRVAMPAMDFGNLKRPPLSQFTLMSRDYLTKSVQSKLKSAKGLRPLDANKGSESEVQLNVFPYAQPQLGATGTNRLLVWIADAGTARSDENRTLLVCQRWNGTDWMNPTPVWDEATADFAPSLGMLTNGSALVAWQNERIVLPTNAPLEQALANFEIAAAKFEPVTSLWTPSNLTDNNYLDHSPRLSAASNGTAMLTWIGNHSNDPLGSVTSPNEVLWRKWDESAWGDAGVISSNVPMLLWSTVAYDGTNGVFLATIDPDDDQSTTADQELWGATFDGVAWAPLERLTSNSVQDTKPQAVYDNSGRLVVVWYQDTNLVMRIGDLNLGSPAVVGQLNGASSQKDFHLVTGPAGQISMVWEDLATDGGGPDPMLLNYDATLGAWSQPLRLLANTNQLERSFSGAYADNGALLMAYNSVAVTYDTNNVPNFGQVDLMFLDYQIGNDLAVNSSDVVLSTNNPTPGQSVNISAIVRNTGEFGATNVQTVFYDGNPSNGGSLIGSTQTVAGVLLAGSNATVQVAWLIPQTVSNRTIYVVVDPALKQTDRNRADNTATKTVLAPDLQISEMTVLQSSASNRVINARCVNGGTIPSGSAVEVTFRRWSINGPVLATVPIANVPTNGVYDANFEWNLSGLTFTNAFELVYATVDAGNLVSEAEEGNNTRSASVMTSLDSDSDGLLDGEEARYGTNPLLPDSDNDGLNDEQEVNVHHTDPTKRDTDGDGMSDGAEIAAGTDPNSASSVLKFSSVQPNPNGNVELVLKCGTGRTYLIQASTNLVNWESIYSWAATSNGITFTDTNANSFNQCYYRALVFPSANLAPHPADLNADYRLASAEVVRYDFYHAMGYFWPIPPNPIPTSYATNADFIRISTAGGVYHCDQTLSPPACWVPGE